MGSFSIFSALTSSHLTNRATGDIALMAMSGPRRGAAISYSDQLSTQSTRIVDDLMPEFQNWKYRDSESTASSSFFNVPDGPQGESC
jgi:hypothetical protein